MNFLKQLLQINPCQHDDSDKSPQQSGQFQVIQFDQTLNNEQNQQNMTQIDSSLVSSKNLNKKNSHSQINGQHKQAEKNPQNRVDSDQIKQLNQKLSKQYTIIQIDEQQMAQKCNGSASTIKIDQYYMIINTEQITKKFTTIEQWLQFFKKINCFYSQMNKLTTLSMNSSSIQNQTQKKKTKISLTIKQLNSILQIKPQDLQLREMYWNNIAYPPISIRFKYTQLANKKDPQKLQKNVNKIMESLAHPILFEIIEKKYKVIQNVQDELQRWNCLITKLLTLYGANDKQIGYSKGLQYLALGILVSKPFGCKSQAPAPSVQQSCYFNSLSCSTQPTSTVALSSVQQQYSALELHFKYLLFTKQLRNMYFPGTPKLYEEIEHLSELMRNQVSQLYELLQSSKVDLIKLFINYYKTFLLYKIKNPEVVRKIMELLLIYGIDLVRILLSRIMNRNEKKILEIKDQMVLLKYLAEQIVDDYFGNSDTQEVIEKFKQLFILNCQK